MTNQIEKALMNYGSTYTWVKNNIAELANEVANLLKKENVPANEHNIDRAAFLVIDKRF